VLHSSKKVEFTRRVPHLQQKENSTKITNQIPLNNKPDCCFPSHILKLFKDISSETPILTLLEAVQKKKTELPYKKGSYQKEHNENHFIIFLKKVSTWRQENVSTTYIFEKLNLKKIRAIFSNSLVSKVLIRKFNDSIIFKKSATFSLPVCVACRSFLGVDFIE